MTGSQPDARALFAEERAVVAQGSPEAYLELLQRRIAERPVYVDTALLEQAIAERPWQDVLRPVACRILGYPGTPPEDVVVVNTFHRVPVGAAETVLVHALGLRRGSLHSAVGGRDVALDRMTALQEFRPKSLVRAHVTGTARVRAFLALLGIRPILMVRDVFDTIASYADDRTDPRMPGPAYRFAALEPAQRRRILVMRMASQLVDFFASWTAEAATGRCVLHRWEDVRHDWVGFLTDRLAELGRTLPRESIAAALASLPPDPHSEPGRGETLSDDDRALVRSLYAQYPTVDFRPIDASAPPPG